jgi:hypothetical protein
MHIQAGQTGKHMHACKCSRRAVACCVEPDNGKQREKKKKEGKSREMREGRRRELRKEKRKEKRKGRDLKKKKKKRKVLQRFD